MHGPRVLLATAVLLTVLPAGVGALPAADHAAQVTADEPEAELRRGTGEVQIRYTAGAAGLERHIQRPGLAGLTQRPSVAQLRAAWLEQAAMTAGVDAEASTGAEMSYLEMASAPDLDGDGKKDLISIAGAGDTVTYRGVRGKTGEELWQHEDPGAFGFVFPARVGADGNRGVILTSVAFEGGEDPESPNFSTTTMITAVAADGAAVWSHSYSGSGTATPTGFVYQGLAQPSGWGRMTESPADDTLVLILDGAETPVSSSSHAQVQIIDGADGSTAAATDVVAAGGWIGAGVVGDLDGDGLQDLVTSAAQGGDQNTLAAHRSADATTLWQSTVAGTIVWGLQDAGRTDADAAPDVLTSGFDDESFSGTAALLSGADGTVRWESTGDVAVPVRDATGDGFDDIAIQRAYDGFMSDDPERSDRFGARYLLRSGADGTVAYRRTFAVTFGNDGGMGMVGLFGAAGDADGDRRMDMAHEASVMGFDGEGETNSGVVRSRDGRRTLRRGIGTPLFARVDARGHDFAVLDDAHGLLRLTLKDGRTGQRLWRRLLPQPANGGYVSLTAADVVGNRRAELVVVVPRRSGTATYVLRSGRGNTLWRH